MWEGVASRRPPVREGRRFRLPSVPLIKSPTGTGIGSAAALVSKLVMIATRGRRMATGDNAAVVSRAYEAFNTADMETLTELFDESASWHTPGRGSFSGDRKDRDETLAFFGRLGQETGGSFRATLRH